MTRPFFALQHVPIDRIHEHAGALSAIHDGQLDGVLVEGAMAPELAAVIAQRLDEHHARRFDEIRLVPDVDAFMQSPVLVRAESWEQYLGAAEPWREACAWLCEGGPTFSDVFSHVLGALAGPHPVRVPTRGGRPFVSDTVRRLPPGGRLPRHIEVEQTFSPTYAEFNAQLDGMTMWSVFLLLQSAEHGGELVVYETAPAETDLKTLASGRVSEATLDRRPVVRVAPKAGDMVIFAGGRFFHEISPIEGTRTRWTLGSFMARSADGESFLRWS